MKRSVIFSKRVLRYVMHAICLFPLILTTICAIAWIDSYRVRRTGSKLNILTDPPGIIIRKVEWHSERGGLELSYGRTYADDKDSLEYYEPYLKEPRIESQASRALRYPFFGPMSARAHSPWFDAIGNDDLVGSQRTFHLRVIFPWWSITALTSLLGCSWLWLVFRRLRVRKRKQGAVMLCPSCGYDLRATPFHCPECGWRGVNVPPAGTDTTIAQ